MIKVNDAVKVENLVWDQIPRWSSLPDRTETTMGGTRDTLVDRIKKAGQEGKKQARIQALKAAMPRQEVTLLITKKPHMHFAKWLKIIDEVLSDSSGRYPAVTGWSGKVE